MWPFGFARGPGDSSIGAQFVVRILAYIAPCPCGNPAGQWLSTTLATGGTRTTIECDACEEVAA
jgi:hypothetical protein